MSRVLLADIGVLAAGILSYLPGAEWLSTNRAFIFGAGIVAIALMGLVSHAGLALGRLIHGLSGALVVAMFLAMLALAIPKWIDGPAYPPLSLAVPAFTLFNLNILGKMGFGALGGFDTVAIFAGECRDADAAKVIRRSVWIASPISRLCSLLAPQPRWYFPVRIRST